MSNQTLQDRTQERESMSDQMIAMLPDKLRHKFTQTKSAMRNSNAIAEALIHRRTQKNPDGSWLFGTDALTTDQAEQMALGNLLESTQQHSIFATVTKLSNEDYELIKNAIAEKIVNEHISRYPYDLINPNTSTPAFGKLVAHVKSELINTILNIDNSVHTRMVGNIRDMPGELLSANIDMVQRCMSTPTIIQCLKKAQLEASVKEDLNKMEASDCVKIMLSGFSHEDAMLSRFKILRCSQSVPSSGGGSSKLVDNILTRGTQKLREYKIFSSLHDSLSRIRPSNPLARLSLIERLKEVSRNLAVSITNTAINHTAQCLTSTYMGEGFSRETAEVIKALQDNLMKFSEHNTPSALSSAIEALNNLQHAVEQDKDLFVHHKKQENNILTNKTWNTAMYEILSEATAEKEITSTVLRRIITRTMSLTKALVEQHETSIRLHISHAINTLHSLLLDPDCINQLCPEHVVILNGYTTQLFNWEHKIRYTLARLQADLVNSVANTVIDSERVAQVEGLAENIRQVISQLDLDTVKLIHTPTDQENTDLTAVSQHRQVCANVVLSIISQYIKEQEDKEKFERDAEACEPDAHNPQDHDIVIWEAVQALINDISREAVHRLASEEYTPQDVSNALQSYVDSTTNVVVYLPRLHLDHKAAHKHQQGSLLSINRRNALLEVSSAAKSCRYDALKSTNEVVVSVIHDMNQYHRDKRDRKIDEAEYHKKMRDGVSKVAASVNQLCVTLPNLNNFVHSNVYRVINPCSETDPARTLRHEVTSKAFLDSLTSTYSDQQLRDKIQSIACGIQSIVDSLKKKHDARLLSLGEALEHVWKSAAARIKLNDVWTQWGIRSNTTLIPVKVV